MTPKVKLNLKGRDATQSLLGEGSERLISLNITDQAGVKSDRFDLSLVRDKGTKPPKAGSVVDVAVGMGDHPLTPLGRFKLDSIETSGGRSGNFLTLSGTAAGMQGAIKARRTQTYHNITLADLAKTIAGRHGLEAVIQPTLAAYKLPQLFQMSESDMNLLTRTMKGFDGFFKVADGKLIIASSRLGLDGKGEVRDAISLNGGDIIDWKWKAGKRAEKSGGVKAKSFDVKSGRYKSVFDEDVADSKAKGEPHEIGGIMPYEESARLVARSANKKSKKGKGETESLFLTLIGNPSLRAGSLIELTSSPPEISGEWEAEQVTHSLSRSGYTTQINFQRKD